MTLHIETLGQGPDLVMLHGWAMHSAIWYPAARQLAEHFCVHLVDLPGHGWSKSCTAKTLDDIVSVLSPRFVGPVSVCGWSLGGLVAMRWAVAPSNQITRLMLVAASPCFTKRDDWSPAMDQKVLAHFASELDRDYDATLQRFLALQVLNSASPKALLQNLQKHLFDRGQYDAAMLGAGLKILEDNDVRHSVKSIAQPTLLLYGDRDTLVPVGAGQWLAENLPNARLEIFSGSAHLPFVSHQDAFVSAVSRFIDE